MSVVNEWTFTYEHGVCNGFGRCVHEAMAQANEHMKQALGPRFSELGEIVKISRFEHGTEFVSYVRE